MTSPSASRNEARLQRRLAALAARAEMSPLAPAPEGHLRVATWNVNSLRARAPALDRFLDRARPNVLCLQETKASVVRPEAAAVLERHGYHVVHIGNGAYNGVAIASVDPITNEEASGSFGDEHLDRDPRLITCITGAIPEVRIVCLYVPHGREVGHWHYEFKLGFLDQLAARVRTWVSEGPVILAGDMNVAPTDNDVFHPDAFVGLTHVTEPERRAWAGVLDAGLVDVDVAVWGPRARRFTWWDHGISYSRNLGMRLDVIAASEHLAARVERTWIDHLEREAERPSDHAALLADFDVSRPLEDGVQDSRGERPFAE